jgi:ribonuclease HII
MADDSDPGRPDYGFEENHGAPGIVVCGVDEAGRGPLAGPVVAAAVILDARCIPDGLNDSKKLSPGARQRLFTQLLGCAHVGFCAAPPPVIGGLNIRGATHWAMAEAIKALCIQPALALIDGHEIPGGLPCPGVCLIKGDARSVSIAAASIVAKVVRDEMCAVLETADPRYGFGRHKGYPTKAHREALTTHGATRFHRQSFAPVARTLNSA